MRWRSYSLASYLAWPSHSRVMRGYQTRLKLQEAIWYREAGGLLISDRSPTCLTAIDFGQCYLPRGQGSEYPLNIFPFPSLNSPSLDALVPRSLHTPLLTCARPSFPFWNLRIQFDIAKLGSKFQEHILF